MIMQIQERPNDLYSSKASITLLCAVHTVLPGSKVYSRGPGVMIFGSICDYLYVVFTVIFVSL